MGIVLKIFCRTIASCGLAAAILFVGYHLGYQKALVAGHRLRTGFYWLRRGPVEASLTVRRGGSLTLSGDLASGRVQDAHGFLLIFHRRGRFGVPSIRFGEIAGRPGQETLFSRTDQGLRARWSFKGSVGKIDGQRGARNWWRIGSRWVRGACPRGRYLEYRGRAYQYDRTSGEFTVTGDSGKNAPR